MYKFLDITGLNYLWGKIKSLVPDLSKKTSSIPFGQVDSTSTATVITAQVDGIDELRDGVCCYLKNGVVSSTTHWTLNINGLGAKPVYQTMAAAGRITTLFNVNYTMLFVYNSSRVEGGCWDMFYGYNSNSDTTGYIIRHGNSSLPISTNMYRYRLVFTSADGTKYVPANSSTSANTTAVRTPTQEKINPFGEILYYNTTTAQNQGALLSVSAYWNQYPFALGYSFNNTGAALSLSFPKPVYIKCSPQDDGSAIIDENEPYTQELPVTDDGKIYIFLGIAYSATNVELLYKHPVYAYKDGAIRTICGYATNCDVKSLTNEDINTIMIN